MRDELNRLTVLSSDDLEAWNNAQVIAFMLEEEGVQQRVDCLMSMPKRERTDAMEAIGDEVDSRAQHESDVLVAHIIEQAEARNCEPPKLDDQYNKRILAERAARLVKLLHLNAPDEVVRNAVDIIVKVANRIPVS